MPPIASILQSTASAEPVNKLAVDSMIADIDERISRQMDVIIHAPAFQQVESFWRSLKTMVDRVDFRENIKVNVLHVTKQELLEDFEFAPEIIQSGFYKHVYSSGFGQFGGEPIAAVLGAYEFKNTAPDMKLLQYVSAVGAMAHAPFLSSVSPEFMGLNSWTELPNIKDLYAIFEGPAYTKWRALRDSEDSRYLGLTAPRFLLRQPYSPTDNPVKNFNYYEDVSQNHEDYLWGNWEYIDGEIVKLGSLAHSQLDIPELQRRGLVILASESKDFRLLAHLLRTLQHAGDPHLALRLLALYVEHYWAVAAPQNMAHKKRFASQVIKRFETGIEVFSQNAATAQRDALSGELAKLAQCWQSHNAPELAQATDDLFALYQRAFNRAAPAPVPTPAASGSSPQTTATSESGVTQPSAPAPQIVIDSHDDKAWRDTLLKVAAILCERQPDSPQGYRLRRHALWQNITSTPQAESDGRTPLAAVSADMVADYHAQLGSADMTLWQQVEKSVLLAPYWLDGHCLSAQTALRLGYKQVADAIRDEVIRFLERLPQLTGLLFNDHTPFISEQTKQWLAASPDAKVAPVTNTPTTQRTQISPATGDAPV
ncbi:TPA: type VI secretion system protein TssA [Escherichia coli]|nr:type VI secretion system protein TssA [Escherichia coli]